MAVRATVAGLLQQPSILQLFQVRCPSAPPWSSIGPQMFPKWSLQWTCEHWRMRDGLLFVHHVLCTGHQVLAMTRYTCLFRCGQSCQLVSACRLHGAEVVRFLVSCRSTWVQSGQSQPPRLMNCLWRRPCRAAPLRRLWWTTGTACGRLSAGGRPAAGRWTSTVCSTAGCGPTCATPGCPRHSCRPKLLSPAAPLGWCNCHV